MSYIGVHINSFPDLLIQSTKEAFNLGANIIQLFVNTKLKDSNIYNDLKTFLAKKRAKCIVHISYTINLGKDWDNYSWWILQMIDEIKLAEKLGAEYVVVHMGKRMDLSLEETINNMYSSLLYIHQQTKDLNVKILLETSTGQGSEIGYKLEELTKIYRKLSKHKKSNVRNKFGICLDTCHVFSAGYNLSSKQAIEIFLNNFNEMIGIKEIKLIHLNDSKVPCGSNIDRHENFGNGYIGKDALKILGNAFIKKKIPIIIETSYPKIYDDLDFVLDSIIVQ